MSHDLIGLKTSIKERYRLGDMIGKSAAMHDVYENIIKAAATDANIIILGKSGTGKELAARAIHNLSGRNKRAFIPINCGAIPETLFESEFFGYKKGAFSGAHTDKNGFLDIADKGTLFMDEVGEISPGIQAKLLRAIDGEGYTPLGDNKIKKADVRLIAATNRNLKDMVAKGDMREDFYYRIHIIPINLPPLKDRKEDIPLLAEHFMKLYDPEKKMPVIKDRFMESFLKYHWPGNVRELKSVIQRYVTLKTIDLPAPFAPYPNQHDTGLDIQTGRPLQDALLEFEKAYILKTLEQNNWHRGKAASLLGISRKTLFRKMKTHQLGQS